LWPNIFAITDLKDFPCAGATFSPLVFHVKNFCTLLKRPQEIGVIITMARPTQETEEWTTEREMGHGTRICPCDPN